MKIHVSQDCIRIGQPCQPKDCPIALAIAIQVPGSTDIQVRLTTLSFRFDKQTRMFELSREARKFISTFDAGKPVEPISIILPYFSKPQTGGPK